VENSNWYTLTTTAPAFYTRKKARDFRKYLQVAVRQIIKN
jgi:hypothetical protein